MLFLDKIFQDILAVAAGPGPLSPGVHPVSGHCVATSMPTILWADQWAQVTGHTSDQSNTGTVWMHCGSPDSREVGTVSVMSVNMSSEQWCRVKTCHSLCQQCAVVSGGEWHITHSVSVGMCRWWQYLSPWLLWWVVTGYYQCVVSCEMMIV